MPKVDTSGNIITTPGDTAKDDVQHIPGWSTWTAAQAEAWINTNVTDLASARVALVAMAKMIVYLRNRIWSDLQE